MITGGELKRCRARVEDGEMDGRGGTERGRGQRGAGDGVRCTEGL